ncbi:MAG: helix-turn-helix domain-containing protein [Gemmatimonadaceae bacterium]|nr:helix-turn-helix domain-containing protein [Gemmatimonadaceae bacterium]
MSEARFELIDSPEALGHALHHARSALGLTQERAAELCGVSRRLWSEAESGRRTQLGFATALRMINVMGLDVYAGPRGALPARGRTG